MTPATIQIIQGDARDLSNIPDESIQTIITSPPYYAQRDYKVKGQIGLEARHDCMAWARNEPPCSARSKKKCFVCTMRRVFGSPRDNTGAARILREDGVLWLNIGDTYNAYNGNRGDTGGFRAPLNQQQQRRLTGSGLTSPELKQKDMMGIPWRVALALQADGWYLRRDVIWHKPNCMPESVDDRPVTVHEYFFMLTKSRRYFYDGEAVKEAVTGNAKPRVGPNGDGVTPKARKIGQGSRELIDRDPRHERHVAGKLNPGYQEAMRYMVSSRRCRSVWTIPTASYSGAHYATFPPGLIKPCVLSSTSERGACPKCQAPWERITTLGEPNLEWQRQCGGDQDGEYHGVATKLFEEHGAQNASEVKARILEGMRDRVLLGWYPTCQCDSPEPLPKYPKRPAKPRNDSSTRVVGSPAWEKYQAAKWAWEKECKVIDEKTRALCKLMECSPTVPCVVADIFGGSGTTAKVSLEYGRSAVVVELNPEYIPQIKERTNVTPAMI